MSAGNCYHVSEAAYHVLGGKAAGWTPMRLKVQPDDAESHWFLRHESGAIVDLSVRQFAEPPDYSRAVGAGFVLTPSGEPSRGAQRMIELLTWQAP